MESCLSRFRYVRPLALNVKCHWVLQALGLFGCVAFSEISLAQDRDRSQSEMAPAPVAIEPPTAVEVSQAIVRGTEFLLNDQNEALSQRYAFPH
jgi:hypothetical protein